MQRLPVAPETGMRYYNGREDAKSTVYDHYTGVGEVFAVHCLDEVFAGLGRHIRVKRGNLFFPERYPQYKSDLRGLALGKSFVA